MGNEGFELTQNLGGKSVVLPERGTNSGTVDSELAQLATAWPNLPAEVRANILAMVKAQKGGA
jgi:hypothetical protein